jgi:hypothetical protein
MYRKRSPRTSPPLRSADDRRTYKPSKASLSSAAGEAALLLLLGLERWRDASAKGGHRNERLLSLTVNDALSWNSVTKLLRS